MKRCLNCFKTYDEKLGMCPFCGYEDGDEAAEPYFLKPGTVLANKFIIGETIGFGGFGITYKAFDKSLNSIVAIKEYFYSGVVIRKSDGVSVQVYSREKEKENGHFLTRFLDEARSTARFISNKNIVNVYDFFEENNTAYMVMELLTGTTLSDILKKEIFFYESAVEIMKSLTNALSEIHKAGIIHRDISPDNIFIKDDGTVKLIDFGAARFSKNETEIEQKMTMIMKPGFSPPEQYQTVSKQGVWTDMYALAATLYYMVTGIKPEESTNRKTEDNLLPPNEIVEGLPDYINASILRGMAVDIHLRFKTDEEFLSALTEKVKVLDVKKEKKRRRRNRLYGLSAAAMIIIICFGIASFNTYQSYKDRLLPDAQIVFYYQASADYDVTKKKEETIKSVINEFNKDFDNVTVEAVAFDNLTEIVDLGEEAPNIFETTYVTTDSQVLLDNANSVENVYTQFSRLSKNEDTSKDDLLVIDNNKQISLGFYLPAKYTNIGTEITNTTEDINIFSVKEAKYYIGTTLNFYRLKKDLSNNLIIETYAEADKNPILTDKYSIGKCTEDQKKVVDRFLAFCLSDKAQRIFYASDDLSAAFPINKIQLKKYEDIYKNDYHSFFEQNNLLTVDASEE
ncbi:MAG: serine/threonine protein kinase [Prevotella sp.]|jgi:serine/threonine protein kinase|nr:serine/threonine protein kinase [Prevotella sp.]